MNHTSFNMAETTSVIERNWKKILLFTTLTTVVATITVFLMPAQYRSTAKIISANPKLADKSRLFNDHILELYSYFGTGDDLDRIMGVTELSGSYQQLVNTYNLVDYYKIKKDSLAAANRKAVLKLKKNLSIERTEEGQLTITCWTKDRNLSASIVNTLIDITQKKLELIWQSNYQLTQEKLNKSIALAEQQYVALNDSLLKVSPPRYALIQKHMETLLQQLTQYRKTAAEFKLMGETAPPALYILEAATPAGKAERPDKPAIILAAAIAGFVFSLLRLLLANRKQL